MPGTFPAAASIPDFAPDNPGNPGISLLLKLPEYVELVELTYAGFILLFGTTLP